MALKLLELKFNVYLFSIENKTFRDVLLSKVLSIATTTTTTTSLSQTIVMKILTQFQEYND